MLSIVTIASLMVGSSWGTIPSSVSAANVVEFKTQKGGVFDGMPLFDGNPDHLNSFVDTYFEYTGLEGPAVYVTGSRNHYTLTKGANAGKVIPGALSAADNVQGVSTDFPALIGMGQSWNKELLSEIGEVMGNEKISKLKVKQGESNIHGGEDSSLSVAFTVVSDMRINPLSGRFDEGFSEDPNMAGVLIDKMATGLSGIGQPATKDGFWMRAAVGTKHYSVYNAQWFRQTANNSAGARSLFEYQTRAALPGFESGALAGTMTSYGRTNGIPNILSPLQLLANLDAKYGVYSSPDFNGDAIVSNANQLGNGYDDRYAVDRGHATVLMAFAKANAGRPSGTTPADVTDLVTLVEQGEYGITGEELIEAARPHVNQLVRLGIFNETDEQGIPKDYPFAQEAKDVRTSPPSDYNQLDHQDVALRAAQESIVLLKNDNTLPLEKGNRAAVSGVYADARFKTTYSVGTTPALENSGESPLLSIIKMNGSSNVNYTPGGEVIALTSKANQQTVTADVYSPNAGKEGAQLITTADTPEEASSSHLFRVYDWGQEGSSLLSLHNQRWMTSPATNNAAVGNTDGTSLNLTNNDWSLPDMMGDTSAIPPTLRIENNEDGSLSIVANGYRTGFSGDFTNWYYAHGRFIKVDDDGKLVTSSSPLGSKENAANRPDEVKFEKSIVQDVGEEAAARAAEDDYAIVFVGAAPRHSAGEGNDRSSLDMGEADYALVDNVSAAFAAEGKKTVVVVKSSFPVSMERIQNNPNVSAIVYQPYGGQYDSYALAQVLYGDYAPTGRLTSTWYAGMDAFPSINSYVVPEGNTSGLDSIDPRFAVDMTNADPIESGLTYMYTDAKVTYPFGYGLSYAGFSYDALTAPSTVPGDEPFTVSVRVTNTGDVATSEVVQLYARNSHSAYGAHAPKKKLVAFEKVYLEPGQSREVPLQVDPQTLSLWDVNRSEWIVEQGSYDFMIGTSAGEADVQASKAVSMGGKLVASLSLTEPINVFDHAFASNEVVYHEVSKERTAAQLKAKAIVGGYYAVRSKQNGSWVALPKADLTGARKVKASVASNAQGGTISLHADTLDSSPLAVWNVPVTDPVSYKISNANVTVKELGYVDVEADISAAVSGVHDLYLVFHEPDLRIDGLSFTLNETGTNPGSPGTNPGTNPGSPSSPGSGNGAAPVDPPASESETEGETNSGGNLSALVTVQKGSEADQQKVKSIRSSGVRVIGEPWNVTIKDKQGIYVTATLPAVNDVAADSTAIVHVGEAGKLTPVPGVLTQDTNGNQAWKVLINQAGTYVAIHSKRTFVDVASSAWYAGDIAKASSKLLINGVSERRVQPQGTTTSAQTLMAAMNAIGIDPGAAALNEKWFDPVLRAAVEYDLMEEGQFLPNAPMSREGMAIVLIHALNLAGVDTELPEAEIESWLEDFKDRDQLTPNSRSAMAAAIGLGIFQGTPEGLLQPQSTLTRSQLATVIVRVHDRLAVLLEG
ncbi:glycoside hydrolase family 3 C-terminal domain-containing protein [Paenibacillus xylanilyticus]|uniref:Carbohydrate-binding protein n=1 Tax=Paenibacillus xylanilyticus TaxID=248903 RepID=A0A7Y6BSR6_9BACL|nr:glycoside hydrolase family 3 C-terminal domain-containing protein [Paenibacillus xylanilyticus]NUU74338.1 carbohydrate-binding protein [Paenibacillus xylanilyticus]